MEIFKLFGTVLVDNDKANESISKTDKQAEGLGKKFMGMTKTAAKWGAAIFAGASAAVGAVVGLTTKVGNMADRLLDLSAITGMSTDEIQRWERVTKEAGVSTDAVTSASQKLTKQMSQLENGTGKGSEALAKLGVTFDEINSLNPDERMDKLIKKLSEIEDPAERARVGTELFGAEWKNIAPIVDMGAEAMDKAKASANIFSEEDLQKANDFRISMDLMKDRVSFLAMELAMNLLPVAQRFLDWVDTKMPQIESIIDTTFTILGEIVNVFIDVLESYLFPALEWLWSWVEQYLPEIQVFFQTVFEAIKAIIENFTVIVKTLWDAFGEDIKTVTTIAFEAIAKIIETVLGIVQGLVMMYTGLVSGDWGLFAEGLEKVWVNLWETIETVVSGAWSILTVAFASLYRNIKGWFDGLARDAVNWGKNMIQGFIDGIRSMIGAVADAVGSVMDSVKDFLGFNSPTKKGEGRNIVNWGNNMIDGFMDGIDKAMPNLEAKLNTVIPNMGNSGNSYDYSRKQDIHVVQHIYVQSTDERAIEREAMRSLRKILPAL